MSEAAICAIYLFGLFQGFAYGMGWALDGKSPFWTGYMDVMTLRVFIRKGR